MNYLAHCLLSCSEDDILIGNFMTDFLKKSEVDDYEGRIKDGIELHRAIDTFTDAHPITLKLRADLRPRHGKYASVVVDLIWDFYLSKNWSQYSEDDFERFRKDTYRVLLNKKEVLPSKLKSKIDAMIDNDFLIAYASKENMRHSLAWMDRRVNFKSAFHSAILDVEEKGEQYEEWFHRFMPDLIEHSKLFCSC